LLELIVRLISGGGISHLGRPCATVPVPGLHCVSLLSFVVKAVQSTII